MQFVDKGYPCKRLLSVYGYNLCHFYVQRILDCFINRCFISILFRSPNSD